MKDDERVLWHTRLAYLPALFLSVLLVAFFAPPAASALARVAPAVSAGSSTTTSNHAASRASVSSTTATAQPVRVLLFGDSVALTLGVGLGESRVQDKYGYRLSDDGILGCGVVDGPAVELMGSRDITPTACNGTPYSPGEALTDQPWQNEWADEISSVQPNVVVLLAGRWEVVDREYQGAWTNILRPSFAAYVKHQLNQASQIVTSTGARMVFLTAPCVDEGEQPDGDPWPEDNPARLAVYNKLVREVAAEHPQTDSVVDLFKAVCPKGTYTRTVDGSVVRRSDGVHFSNGGGVVLAPKIMPPIVAVGRAQAAAEAARPGSTSSTTAAPAASVAASSSPDW